MRRQCEVLNRENERKCEPAVRCGSGQMRQTDGRTSYRYIDPVAYVRVMSITVCSSVVTHSALEQQASRRVRHEVGDVAKSTDARLATHLSSTEPQTMPWLWRTNLLRPTISRHLPPWNLAPFRHLCNQLSVLACTSVDQVARHSIEIQIKKCCAQKSTETEKDRHAKLFYSQFAATKLPNSQQDQILVRLLNTKRRHCCWKSAFYKFKLAASKIFRLPKPRRANRLPIVRSTTARRLRMQHVVVVYQLDQPNWSSSIQHHIEVIEKPG